MKRKQPQIVDPRTRETWSRLWPDMPDGTKSESTAAIAVPGPQEPDIEGILGEAEEGDDG
jgi:hypothetical protein